MNIAVAGMAEIDDWNTELLTQTFQPRYQVRNT